LNHPLISLPHLRTLIGLRVRHMGEACRVVEVLEAPLSLVLEPEGRAALLADIHGRPWEYGMQTHILQVLTDDQTGLNDALLELEILD
jgi:hypothetical protein